MEITQGAKATAISSAERVRVFKEFGMRKYYQEVRPSYSSPIGGVARVFAKWENGWDYAILSM